MEAIKDQIFAVVRTEGLWIAAVQSACAPPLESCLNHH